MKIVELQQRSEEWHIWRRSGIGSSDICVLMECNPYKTPLDLYHEKHSPIIEMEDNNEAMRRGIVHENEALSWCSKTLGVSLIPVCLENEGNTWMKASVDGYNKEQNFVVEIKIPLVNNYEAQCITMKEMHFCQIQWHLLVSGMHSAYLCVYSPENKAGILRYVASDEEYQKKMMETAQSFWFNHVLKEIPPEKKEIREIFDLKALESSNELETYIDMRKKFESLENDLKESFLSYQDGTDFKVGNLVFKYYKGSKRLDREMMKQDGIDLSKYEIEGKPYYKIEVKK